MNRPQEAVSNPVGGVHWPRKILICIDSSGASEHGQMSLCMSVFWFLAAWFVIGAGCPFVVKGEVTARFCNLCSASEASDRF
jgi:hypothetical protein